MKPYLDDVSLLQRRGAAAEHGGAAPRQREEWRDEPRAAVEDVGERAAVHDQRARAQLGRRAAALQVVLYRRLRVLLDTFMQIVILFLTCELSSSYINLRF